MKLLVTVAVGVAVLLIIMTEFRLSLLLMNLVVGI